MKILIAGGAGYIGSVLVPKLIEIGHAVNVIDLFWFGNHLPQETGIIHKDIFKLSEKDVEGHDVVIFLAGLSNDPMAEFDPSMNFIFNASAPAYLAYISKRAGAKRFIYAGSCSVYGFTENKLYDEKCKTESDYPYGISKLQGERAVLQLASKNFSTICLRQGTVSGYSPRMRLDLVVNTMFKSAMMTGKITVNNPKIWRPVLAIQDAAQAYIKSVESKKSVSGIFNVASGNFTVGEIAKKVRKELKKKLKLDVKIENKKVKDMRNYKVSVSKAKKNLGFKQKFTIEKIVDELVKNYPLFKDFGNENYYNIEVFKKLK